MAERAGLETPVLKVAGSKPIHSKVILIRGFFFYLFVFHFIKLLLVVFWFVCEAQLLL